MESSSLPSSFCRAGGSSVVANETSNDIVIAHRNEHEIALIQNKQEAQIPPDAAFVKSAERPDTDAGMQMRPPKNFRQPGNGGIGGGLLCWRQPLERTLI